MKTGNPLRGSVKNWMSLKARYTIGHWWNQYCTIQTAIRSYTPAEFDAIAKRLKKLEHIFAIIRPSGFLAWVPLQEKLSLLEHLHNEMGDFYSIKELCEALEVARGTFYNHIFRRADPQKYQDEKMQLMLSAQMWKSSTVSCSTAKSEICCSGILLLIGAIRRGSAISPISKSTIPEYIFIPSSACFPAGLWDIVYPIPPAPVLVTTTFRKAYTECGNPTELTFHCDRGGQYISDTFSKLLQNCYVKQTFSASGCPYDNAATESFFATFKKEESYWRGYASERHFQKCVEEYIQFYNEVRPHQTLDYKTPQAFEAAHEGNYIGK